VPYKTRKATLDVFKSCVSFVSASRSSFSTHLALLPPISSSSPSNFSLQSRCGFRDLYHHCQSLQKIPIEIGPS
jgi:hypothetical protein